jgi:hypothetical protein
VSHAIVLAYNSNVVVAIFPGLCHSKSNVNVGKREHGGSHHT